MSVPRRLVVSCDGTWNTATDDTNVARLHARLATADDQLPRYFPGVGTDGGPLRRVLDGALGTDLGEHVREVYRWLAETFRPGDELVLLGFSRGAFTVRSTVGMLAQCGLVAFSPDQDDATRTAVVARVFTEGYRAKGDLSGAGIAFHPGFGPDDTAPVAFLGVWDTVGALGIPRTFGLLSGLTGRAGVAFHDLELAPDVRHARQGLAADERRGPYVPSAWPTPPPGRHASFAQVWFPGGHGDVGGGKPETGLSDGALRWMVEELDATVTPAGATTCRRSRRAGRARTSTTASTGFGAC
ncbi:phospholipase effector Tle1 domain-containing protein [Actinomycetospora sp. CA-053990]|uniref:phospholipase effector Tle1 domain-containing protein n=1 Tax=Actinomycetospora sp. CA-053990 TaxID=3239891 RepID=UPI003D900E65